MLGALLRSSLWLDKTEPVKLSRELLNAESIDVLMNLKEVIETPDSVAPTRMSILVPIL